MTIPPRVPPSHAELDKSVEDIVYVIYQCSTYFVWWVHIKPRLNHLANQGAHLQIIENSLIEATLLFIRKLNEFFKDRPTKEERDDDLPVYDFRGFKSVGAFLHPTDYQQLHKRVGHMTLKQVKEGKVSWEMHDAVKLAFNKSWPFLDFLIDEFYVHNPERRNYVRAARTSLRRFSEEMETAEKIAGNTK